MVYVMFAVVFMSFDGGVSSFQYEFKDKIQCENAVKVIEQRFTGKMPGTQVRAKAFCQEVKK